MVNQIRLTHTDEPTVKHIKGSYYEVYGGRIVDLSNIESISNAKFVNRMGMGGWFVEYVMSSCFGNHYPISIAVSVMTNDLNAEVETIIESSVLKFNDYITNMLIPLMVQEKSKN